VGQAGDRVSSADGPAVPLCIPRPALTRVSCTSGSKREFTGGNQYYNHQVGFERLALDFRSPVGSRKKFLRDEWTYLLFSVSLDTHSFRIVATLP
jgi:hypothetical protein